MPFFLDVSPFMINSTAGSGKGGLVKRELFVVADNRFNATTAPTHTGGDFWNFGGLMRSVRLIEERPSSSTKQPRIWRAQVIPIPKKLGTVRIVLKLTDQSYFGNFSFRLQFDRKAVLDLFLSRQRVGAWMPENLLFPRHGFGRSKTPDAPPHGDRCNWYNLWVVERFGLREWSVINGRIALNGKIVNERMESPSSMASEGWHQHQRP